MLINFLLKLNDLDIEVLRYIISNVRRGKEYVLYRNIQSRTRASQKKLDDSLTKLTRLRILVRHPSNPEYYRPTFRGVNVYAVHVLIRKGVIKEILDKLGVGKESEVYLAKRENGEYVVVKFHRIGFTSFKRASVMRDYGIYFQRYGWIYKSIVSAEREYVALNELSKLDCLVPKPYGYAVNAVVTQYIEGVELYKIKNLESPTSVLMDILATIRTAYRDAGIVHGDLSEYNVMVSIDHTERGYIIDWPQWVYRDHESAEILLRRDVEYIVRYFRRRYNIKINFEVAYQYVTGVIDHFEKTS